jgi:hypothetical protein
MPPWANLSTDANKIQLRAAHSHVTSETYFQHALIRRRNDMGSLHSSTQPRSYKRRPWQYRPLSLNRKMRRQDDMRISTRYFPTSGRHSAASKQRHFRFGSISSFSASNSRSHFWVPVTSSEQSITASKLSTLPHNLLQDAFLHSYMCCRPKHAIDLRVPYGP